MTMFDPQTGKLIDRTALRSLAFSAFPPRSRTISSTRDTITRTIIDQDSGRVMGATTEHGSGRVDTEVTPAAAGVGLGA